MFKLATHIRTHTALALSILRSVLGFFATAATLASIALLPIIAFVAWQIVSDYRNAPNKVIAERFAPGVHDVSWRLWRMPWRGLGGGDDTFALQLASFRRHKDVQVFRTDMKPIRIVWRDEANLEAVLPNFAYAEEYAREAFGVTVHVRFEPDDPEARRKHFEEIEGRLKGEVKSTLSKGD